MDEGLVPNEGGDGGEDPHGPVFRLLPGHYQDINQRRAAWMRFLIYFIFQQAIPDFRNPNVFVSFWRDPENSLTAVLEKANRNSRFIGAPELLRDPALVNASLDAKNMTLGYQVLQHIYDGAKSNPGFFLQGFFGPSAPISE